MVWVKLMHRAVWGCAADDAAAHVYMLFQMLLFWHAWDWRQFVLPEECMNICTAPLDCIYSTYTKKYTAHLTISLRRHAPRIVSHTRWFIHDILYRMHVTLGTCSTCMTYYSAVQYTMHVASGVCYFRHMFELHDVITVQYKMHVASGTCSTYSPT